MLAPPKRRVRPCIREGFSLIGGMSQLLSQHRPELPGIRRNPRGRAPAWSSAIEASTFSREVADFGGSRKSDPGGAAVTAERTDSVYLDSYVATRDRIAGLMVEDEGGVPVPSCPGWRVLDVLAHLAGLCEDWVNHQLDGYASESWTAAKSLDSRSTVAQRFSTGGPTPWGRSLRSVMISSRQ